MRVWASSGRGRCCKQQLLALHTPRIPLASAHGLMGSIAYLHMSCWGRLYISLRLLDEMDSGECF